MLNVTDFRLHVIRPTLHHLGLWKPKAEDLVLGTALVESHLHALDPSGDNGGLYRMAPNVHAALWRDFLPSHPRLQVKLHEMLSEWPEPLFQLGTNLAYATAMCRIHYLRVSERLPASPEQQAHYWEHHYASRGEAADYIRAWELVGLDRA